VDFDEILYGSDDIEDDLDSILFNAIASTIPKWRTFKLLRWVHLLNNLMNLDEILYGCDGTEYCLLQAYAGKVGILILPELLVKSNVHLLLNIILVRRSYTGI
jgi:hypothetical protein